MKAIHNFFAQIQYGAVVVVSGIKYTILESNSQLIVSRIRKGFVRRLCRFGWQSSRGRRFRDGGMAGGMGALLRG